VGSRGVHQPFRADDGNIVLPNFGTQDTCGHWSGAQKVNPNVGRLDILMWRGETMGWIFGAFSLGYAGWDPP